MTSSKYLPALVCGFAAAVLMIIPEIKNFGCCLILPAAAAFSLFLNKKINSVRGAISTSDAFFYGIFTGVFSALFLTGFDLLITYFAKTNDLVESLPDSKTMLRDLNLGPIMENAIAMMENMAKDIKLNGFSALYSIMILISNLVINTIFGMIGGLIGMKYLNKRSLSE
jgi:hypothetical protein